MLDKSCAGWYYVLARVGEICGFFKARNAMMQEIARKRGNFCGVCPVIGRLNSSVSQRISLGQDKVGLGRPFFMAQNDTHGNADSTVRPYPDSHAN